ncbi:MAG: hypothetical protein MRT15_03360 [archaeon YNP-LCB-003-016]|uniref:hypothetical protein n=1 Tax=Candidatus Culexarchaeum yellowstonense TaxID=2928963 RepID=UPI0026EFA342|nr:hypothetical protein [Candidatus Culexarchaeum yellowstonense]MCR6691404.1 hypothetical protein [Candidatus Culexarchaeum yellowstonense]
MKALLDEVLIRGKSSPRNNKLKPALREPRGIETLHYREVIELIKDEESPRWPEWGVSTLSTSTDLQQRQPQHRK